MKIKKFAIILDESHRIKNPESKTAAALFSLGPLAKRRIILSGSPVANKPYDLWAQFYFLDEGKTLGDDFNSFKKEFSVNLKSNEFNEDKMQELKDLISSVSMRRLKDDVLELPDKSYKDVFVELTGEQKKKYDQLREELYLEIENMDGDEVEDNSENILKRLLRLTQIASNPLLIDRSYKEDPAKYVAMDKLVKKIISKKEKVIIWTSFVDNIRAIKKRYKNLCPVTIFGQMTIDDRNKSAKRFIEDKECKILIANPAAAREGLTLTVANNAIYLDRSFNLVDYVQSQDRIHRISQTKKCMIYNLIAKNSVDGYIDETIFKKQNIAKFIQGDSDQVMIDKQFLTKEELIEILGG
jgi:SNF2 family DNA or RNA helicase